MDCMLSATLNLVRFTGSMEQARFSAHYTKIGSGQEESSDHSDTQSALLLPCRMAKLHTSNAAVYGEFMVGPLIFICPLHYWVSQLSFPCRGLSSLGRSRFALRPPMARAIHYLRKSFLNCGMDPCFSEV